MTSPPPTARKRWQRAGPREPSRESPKEPGRAVDVLLVDSRPVVREGLCVLIESQPGLIVVGQASTLRDARSGYLLETSPTADVVAAVRAVANRETYLQASLGIELAQSRSWDAMLRLTPQEERVLRLLVLGHTNADIARLCNISPRTAETHRAHIQRKLDRHTRAELVEYAREEGLVQLDPS